VLLLYKIEKQKKKGEKFLSILATADDDMQNLNEPESSAKEHQFILHLISSLDHSHKYVCQSCSWSLTSMLFFFNFLIFKK
jgi:hypothetical protein